MSLGKRFRLLLILGVVFFAATYVIRIRQDMVDFQVNYKAGQRLRAGETLYQAGDGHYMFKYLPFSALLYVPFSYLPLEAAKPIWYSLTVLCSIFAFYLSHRLVSSEDGSGAHLALWPPLILAKFFFREMSLGQINTVVASVTLLMTWALANRKGAIEEGEISAGTLWGLGTALKPYAAIFLPYFLVKRMWRSLAAGIGCLAVALAVPSFFYGWRGNLRVLEAWASTLSRSTPALLTSGDNISIIAFFMKWTGREVLSLGLSGFIVLVLAILLLVVITKGQTVSRAGVLECALLLILIPLVSPLGWDYTLLLSVLGVTLVVHHFHEYPRLWRMVLIVNFCVISLVIFDIVGRPFYMKFMSWSVNTVNFLLVVVALAYLRFRRVC